MNNSHSIVLLLILFLSSLAARAATANCAACDDAAREIKQLHAEKQEAQSQLLHERESLKSLPSDKDSKRMRVNAHLFVLAAKVETAENLLIHKENNFKQNCKLCK